MWVQRKTWNYKQIALNPHISNLKHNFYHINLMYRKKVKEKHSDNLSTLYMLSCTGKETWGNKFCHLSTFYMQSCSLSWLVFLQLGVLRFCYEAKYRGSLIWTLPNLTWGCLDLMTRWINPPQSEYRTLVWRCESGTMSSTRFLHLFKDLLCWIDVIWCG